MRIINFFFFLILPDSISLKVRNIPRNYTKFPWKITKARDMHRARMHARRFRFFKSQSMIMTDHYYNNYL